MNARAITAQPRKQWDKRSIIAVPYKIIGNNTLMDSLDEMIQMRERDVVVETTTGTHRKRRGPFARPLPADPELGWR